jgi:hypothetical protein
MFAAGWSTGGCGPSGAQPICEPESEQACSCADEAPGLQTCQADGQAWGACDCPCRPDCDGKECGQDGCGDSCGECDQPPADACAGQAALIRYEPLGACNAGACAYTQVSQDCPYGCLAGECLPDPCDGLTCDTPPGPCFEPRGSCVREPDAHCEYPARQDGSSCADELACNGQETCQAGGCQPGSPLECGDLADACNTAACDETTGGCVVLPRTDGTVCQDGLFCNGVETCRAGVCEAGAILDCSHLDSQCATGDCSENLRKCVARPQNNGSSCSDGLVCNGSETCYNGECLSANPIACQQPADPCRLAACDESTGGCREQALADDTPCSDRNDCTQGDACQSGVCQGGALTPDGTSCEDGDGCTTGDQCQTGDCIPGLQICSGTVVLLMYMDADNNLDEYLTSDWHEMEAARVDDFPWLRVFVLIDHSSTNDAHLYEVHNHASTELDGPHLGLTTAGGEELNMADGNTLRNFILDVKDIVGLDAKYYLLLSDHGDGWRRSLGVDPSNNPVFRGSCSDDHGAPPGDTITTKELHQAIAGQQLQLVAFDACLMGMAEVAYELRDEALVLIASQELEPGDGWQFTDLLTRFGQAGESSPHAFGQLAVDSYIDSYPDSGWNDTITLAAFDLTRMQALAETASAVADELATMPAANFSATCNDMDWYGCYWGMCEDNTDLRHLTERALLHDDRGNDAIYDQLLQAIDASLIHARHRAGHPNAHGMNVYFPCSGGVSGDYNPTNLDWAADTSWEEMLLAQ